MSKLPSIEKSDDGSHTIISSEFDVAYHSFQGAIEESIVVYIMAGLHYQLDKNKKSVKIFEMAMGTGLNALLTYNEAEKHSIHVAYSGIELYPVATEVITALNYGDILDCQDRFLSLHNCKWGEKINMSKNFQFEKIHSDIETYIFQTLYDVIYFDAFAPATQSHLWEESLHQKLYDTLAPGGVLVTYCAQGKFKRMLRSLGYQVEPLPGPGRKHEMTRAIKLS